MKSGELVIGSGPFPAEISLGRAVARFSKMYPKVNVRIILDHKKTSKYPKLHAWYLNIEKVPHDEVILDIINAGDAVYSYEFVDILVPTKQKKSIKLCKICKEPFIQKDNETICLSCQN